MNVLGNQNLPESAPEYPQSLDQSIIQLEIELERLREALQDTLERLSELENKIPDSSIISPKLLSRAFTVWGHYFVAQLILALPIICISIIIMLLAIAIGDI